MHTTSHSLSINLEATACDHVAAKSENTYMNFRSMQLYKATLTDGWMITLSLLHFQVLVQNVHLFTLLSQTHPMVS